MQIKEYTPEQIQIQAKCFQLLRYNVEQYFAGQKLLPDFLKEEDTDSGIGAVTRWILEENSEEAFGEEM